MFLALRRIHVAASDFSRSRRYYGEILGLPEWGGFEGDWVEFALGPVILKLTPLRPGEVPARNQVALSLDRLARHDALDAQGARRDRDARPDRRIHRADRRDPRP